MRGLVVVAALCGALAGTVRAQDDAVTLTGHVPVAAISRSRLVGRLPPAAMVSSAISLPMRDPAGLEALIARLHDPNDPLYGQYLTPAEVTERFGPTAEDYGAAISYALSQGFTVTELDPNRRLVHLAASAQTVENALNVHMIQYTRDDGRQFFAPDANPRVPAALASKINGFVGLHNANRRHTHVRHARLTASGTNVPPQSTATVFTGLSPTDIRVAYDLPTGSIKGDGQVLGLLILDAYANSDIQTYASKFGFTLPNIVQVLGPGAASVPGGDQDEATLDVEMALAMAPSVSKLMVYEEQNDDASILHGLNKIVTDNIAKVISTSWGDFESDVDPATITAEAAIFQQMAAQGQTFLSASGDNGAKDDGKTLSIDDPGAQPFVTSVGGTQLFLKPDGTFDHESTWNAGTVKDGAGGGGISSIWPIPSYQKNVISQASKASTTMRNVPDIALDADPDTGYAVFISGSWQVYGGTSAASPLWAGFLTLANQQRAAHSQPTIGFFNAVLYPLASGARSASDFHDVSDGSTNLFYPAVAGFDDATGWGSFDGTNLLADLATIAAVPVPTASIPPLPPVPSAAPSPAATATPTPTPTPTTSSSSSSSGGGGGGCILVRGPSREAAPETLGHLLPLLIVLLVVSRRPRFA